MDQQRERGPGGGLDRPRDGGLSLDEWLARVLAEPGMAGVNVSRDEQRALLDLARIAAHRGERIAAPITSYAVGLALASVPPEQRAGHVRRLVEALETDAPA